MNSEEMKKWLSRAYKIDEEINLLKAEKSRIYSTATVGGIGFTVRISPKNIDSTERRMKKYAEYTTLIDDKIAELMSIKTEIYKVISKVSDNAERKVLFCRYVLFMRWDKIAESLNYEERQIYRIHDKAIKDVSECQYRFVI